MTELLVGIDVGTQSSKGVLVRPDGTLVAQARAEHGMDVPRPGWAEQDADAVWWADVCSIARRLVAAVPAGDRIAAVGVSAIGPTLLPLDAAGRPLRRAILYGVDTRATDQIAALEARHGAANLAAWSGMDLSSQAIGPKILWLAEHEPGIHEAARWFVTATTYLVHRLTGAMVIDAHTASHFNPLFDRAALGWSDRYAEGIASVDQLPAIGWPSDVAGTITAAAADATGLPLGVPVAVGTVDALAEAVSVGVALPGDLMVMYGSTTFFILLTEAPVEAGSLWLAAGAERGKWAIAAGLATGGSALAWFRDQLAPDLVAAERAGGLARLRGPVRRGSAGERRARGRGGREDRPRPPLLLRRADADQRSARPRRCRGPLARHDRGALYLGLLEGIAYATRANLEAMRELGASIRSVIAVGGGTADPLLLQLVSDACGIEQEIPAVTIGAARGDALLAGRAIGAVSPADAAAWTAIDHVVRPRPETAAGHDRRYAAFHELYRATRAIVHGLEGAASAR